MGVYEQKQKWVKFEDTEQGVGWGHWYVDEKINIFCHNIVGHLDLGGR